MGTVFSAMAAGVVLLLGILGMIAYYRDRKNRKQAAIKEDVSLPQPGHYFLLAAFLTTLALLAGVLPLKYRPAPREMIDSGTYEFFEATVRNWDPRPLIEPLPDKGPWPVYIFGRVYYVPADTSDIVGNVLLAIPIGFLWTAVFTVDRRKLRALILGVVLVTLGVTALRVVLEFVQYFIAPRIVAIPDIVAELVGVLTGSLAWATWGQRLTEWLRSKTVTLRESDWMDRLLTLWILGFLIYALLPLEFSLRGADLARKYRDGMLVLIPFAEEPWQPGFFLNLALYLPIGMAVGRLLTTPRRPVRPFAVALVLGAMSVAAVEFVQIFILGRFTSITDVLAGLIGVSLGATAMQLVHGGKVQEDAHSSGAALMNSMAPFLAAAGVYTAVLVVMFCTPFEPIHNVETLQVRFNGFFQLSYSTGPYGSTTALISEILGKAMMFAPLAIVLAIPAVGPQVPSSVRGFLLVAIVFYCAALAYCIEMIQVYLPAHVADFTHVVSSTLGAVLGVAVVGAASALRARPRASAARG